MEKKDIFPTIGMTDGERIDTLLRLSIFTTFIIASFFNASDAIIFFLASFMIISLIFTKIDYYKVEKS